MTSGRLTPERCEERAQGGQARGVDAVVDRRVQLA
jgi:hypothetical protein